MRMTREQLHTLGYKPAPDAPGGVVSVRARAFDYAAALGRRQCDVDVKPRPQIRIPKSREPNHTEARWLDRARSAYPATIILYEPITFRLPSGCRYTPDFVAFNGATIAWCAECKGNHIHNERSVRAWKEAVVAFPGWRWIFAQERNGEWCETEMPPQCS